MSTAPTNTDTLNYEQDLDDSLIDSCISLASPIVINQYMNQVPNVQNKEILESPIISELRELGLLGALDGSGVTSVNYKKILYSDDEKN